MSVEEVLYGSPSFPSFPVPPSISVVPPQEGFIYPSTLYAAWRMRLRPQYRHEVSEPGIPLLQASIFCRSYYTCRIGPLPSLKTSHLLLCENGTFDWRPITAIAVTTVTTVTAVTTVTTVPFFSVGVGKHRHVANDLSFTAAGFDLTQPFRIVRTDDQYTITQKDRVIRLLCDKKDLYISFEHISFDVQYTDKIEE